MKKKLLSLLTAALIFSLVACGQPGPKGEKGDRGEQGIQGVAGKDGVDGKDGKDGVDGKDGLIPYIGENGNWWIGDEDTGKPSKGEKGDPGQNGKNGSDGQNGKDGKDGTDAAIAYSCTVISTEEGYVLPSIGSALVGEEITFTVYANEGYVATGVYLNGDLFELDEDNKYTTTMVENGFVVKGGFTKHGLSSKSPLSTEEAVTLASSLESNVETPLVYFVKGVISEIIEEYNEEDGYGSYSLKDSKGNTFIIPKAIIDEMNGTSIFIGSTVIFSGNIVLKDGIQAQFKEGANFVSVDNFTLTGIEITTSGQVVVGEFGNFNCSPLPQTSNTKGQIKWSIIEGSDKVSLLSTTGKSVWFTGLAVGDATIKCVNGSFETQATVHVLSDSVQSVTADFAGYLAYNFANTASDDNATAMKLNASHFEVTGLSANTPYIANSELYFTSSLGSDPAALKVESDTYFRIKAISIESADLDYFEVLTRTGVPINKGLDGKFNIGDKVFTIRHKPVEGALTHKIESITIEYYTQLPS